MDIYRKGNDDHISQRTVVAQVMARLKEEIASGKYRPGDRLPSEQEMAKNFGVGRSSIREAIKVFQHLGVVDSRAAKGTFIRQRAAISAEAITWALLLGGDDLRDVIELRETIESACFARLSEAVAAGDTGSVETLRDLDRQVETMAEAASARNVERMVEADYHFHGVIVNAGGNELFRAIYASLHAFMSQEITASYAAMAELSEAASDHADIVRSLREDGPPNARDRHARHFARTRRLLRISDPGGKGA